MEDNMETRAHNFNAGPAVLPEEVLREIQADLLNYKGTGQSVMEMSHRSKEYQAIIDDTKARVISLYELGDDYEVLFLQGGASLQFFMVPANLCPEDKVANYINTGEWATKAYKEAKKLGKQTHLAASSEESKFNFIPKEFKLSDNPAYLHITNNNTIYGTEYHFDPIAPAGVPLIADMSSNFMSKPIDVKRYGLIYAGAQKNVGPSGCVVVIIRKDLLPLIEKMQPTLPTMISYKTHIDQGSMFNTPPTFAIYIIGLVLKWIEECGGLKQVALNNQAKAKLIYDAIDYSNGFYKGTVVKEDRSLMNITFRLGSEELEEKFIKEAKTLGMIGLKGHRSVGGVRASTYNACPYASCHALAEFMKKFQSEN
jgi:phosphoserine aminotransferase